MPKSAPRLGRGLSAIIGPRTASPFPAKAPPAADAPTSPIGIRQIPIDNITPNPRQPRVACDESRLGELAQSIRSNGILHPVILRSLGGGRYELIAGERRWRAAKLVGLETIPAIIRDLSDAEALQAALVENLQREDLGPLERAAGYEDYIRTFDVNIEQLADRLGESRASVSNYLRIHRLCTEIRDLIARGQLGMGQARALAGIDDPQRQLAIARTAARRDLSVRQVEALARSAAQLDDSAPREPPTKEKHLADVEQALTRALGLPITLHPGKKKNSGRVVIRYATLEEFDRIAERLGGSTTLEDG